MNDGLPVTPTDHNDLLEQRQQAVLRQQEHDLLQMRNSRPLKPGCCFCKVTCDLSDDLCLLINQCLVGK